VTLASVVVWTVTAIFGLTLLIRVGAINKGPKGRSRKRRVLLTIHVSAAATGLLSWIWYAVTGVWGAAVLALLMIVVAASHGLLMVARWSPGHGRHATAERPKRNAGGYFPVHVATAHAMAASSTLTLVVIVVLTMHDWS
jgi:phosphatidylserine synthase